MSDTPQLVTLADIEAACQERGWTASDFYNFIESGDIRVKLGKIDVALADVAAEEAAARTELQSEVEAYMAEIRDAEQAIASAVAGKRQALHNEAEALTSRLRELLATTAASGGDDSQAENG